jgi:hypothetical protein
MTQSKPTTLDLPFNACEVPKRMARAGMWEYAIPAGSAGKFSKEKGSLLTIKDLINKAVLKPELMTMLYQMAYTRSNSVFCGKVVEREGALYLDMTMYDKVRLNAMEEITLTATERMQMSLINPRSQWHRYDELWFEFKSTGNPSIPEGVSIDFYYDYMPGYMDDFLVNQGKPIISLNTVLKTGD